MCRVQWTKWLWRVLFPLSLTLAGCTRTPPPLVEDTLLTVTVSHPVEQKVVDYRDFTGRLAAIESVEIRARVSGYLREVHFKEGALVNKGDILFTIDPRTFQTALDRAEGSLKSMEARLERQKADLRRAERLVGTGAITREEFDKALGDRNETSASLQSLRAEVERAKLDLEFTEVKAPIDGRVGRALVTVGNLVQSGELASGTLLTTIVSVDPIYVYFDVDENTVLQVRRNIAQGQTKSVQESEIPVYLGLANEQDRPHQGKIDFVNNQVNPSTGTLTVRGVFPNEQSLLSPGLFARVRVPIGAPHSALLITDQAIDTDQGQKIVYIVDEKNRIAVRPITVGARHFGLREVVAGLHPSDRVVVLGIMHVRPGLVVEPRLVEMPTNPAGGARITTGQPASGTPATDAREDS